MAKSKDPFDVKLSPEALALLTTRLCDALRAGHEARESVMADNGALDFAYSLYEQQPQMGISREKRPGGADLTSPIGTQMVDTLTAIACKTIFVEPVWIAEGIGADAKKAPAVEEFQQWRLEEMRGQSTLGQAIQQAFIEEGSVVEVCEDARELYCVEVKKAKLSRDETGAVLLNAKDGKPMPMLDEAGAYVPADDTEEFVEVRRQFTDVLRRGATLRTHSLKDFLFLPGHARDRRDIWAMAVRFWMTVEEVQERADHGQFDQDAVAAMGTHDERQERAEHQRAGTTVAVDHASDKVEKELYRVQFYANLDGAGLCFYIATVSLQHEKVLRVQHDWIGRFRFAYLNPYPRTNSVYGYSLILHKLLTTIEGHTAWRNMNADRGMFKSNMPIKRLHGAQWDPRIQPIGPGEVIDVGAMNEIEPMAYEDVSQHAFTREREFYEEAARIAGVSDILASVNPKVQRTLGENEMVTEQSFTRAENPIRNMQEALEDIGELIHAIEVKTLEESEEGIEAPSSVAQNVQLRMPDSQTPGDDAAFAFTAEMISGRFRFKPRGSVETADPNRRVNRFITNSKIAGTLAQMNPYIAQVMQSPPVGMALLQEFVDVTGIRDKQPFLTPPPPPPMPQPPGMPGMEGAPPGPPGPPGMGVPPSFGGDQMIQGMLASLPQGAQ